MYTTSELGLLDHDLVLSFHSCVLKQLLLFAPLEHLNIEGLLPGILLPGVLVGSLLPLAIFYPDTRIGLVTDRESTNGHLTIPLLFHFLLIHETNRKTLTTQTPNKIDVTTYPAKVCVGLVTLQPELE